MDNSKLLALKEAVIGLHKTAFAPSPRVKAAVDQMQAQQESAMAQAQGAAQQQTPVDPSQGAQGLPPGSQPVPQIAPQQSPPTVTLDQIGQGLQQLTDGMGQIMQMLQQMQAPQPTPAPATDPSAAADPNAGAAAPPAKPKKPSIQDRLTSIEQTLQTLTGEAGAAQAQDPGAGAPPAHDPNAAAQAPAAQLAGAPPQQ